MKTSNITHHWKSDRRANHPRAGFTLVEMIVSVALVLLMMLMFTEIFQILSGSMTTQRGISENDQRERLLVTVLQSDLENRSFQYLLPYSDYKAFTTPPGVFPSPSDPRNPLYHKEDRQGYFYISENDPNDDTDDFIQFTVSRFASPKQGDTEDFYYGRATDLSGLTASGGSQLVNHPNQPEADDGRITADGTSQSSAAEVCYFLRGSNLYRRIMLIREPLSLSSTQNSQPVSSDNSNSPFFQRTGGPPLPLYGEHISSDHNFWRDFDYSAYIDSTPNRFARFHDLDDLDNSDTTGANILFPMGMPRYRFGFNHEVDGLSREFVPSSAGSNPQLFIGRFTHEETSHQHFNYPHDLMDSSIGGGGNPMDPAGPNLLLNPNDRVIDLLRNGIRRSEDLVLSNVRSFDIKLFDDGAQDFVDIGGTTAVRFASGAKQNTVHGNSVYKNVFDTWHSRAISSGGDEDPPYPMLSDPTVAEFASQVPVYDIANQTPVPRASPLTAIRILIRYEDTSSGQVRQMTLIHPLRNRGEG
ncbi:type II secretion system protein [uncultured Gimesia sp.]|uniref:PulJ/GspJ family protein n=1 Tax=uncultured Gimesia sp. TaxID=1678688 RepID=UPI00262DC629|nr:type II secretion system protein [uncultured Gimesia sp.]